MRHCLFIQNYNINFVQDIQNKTSIKRIYLIIANYFGFIEQCKNNKREDLRPTRG